MKRLLLAVGLIALLAFSLVAFTSEGQPQDIVGDNSVSASVDAHTLDCHYGNQIFNSSSNVADYSAWNTCLVNNATSHDIDFVIFRYPLVGDVPGVIVLTGGNSCVGCNPLHINGEVNMATPGLYGIESYHSYEAHGETETGTKYHCCARKN